MPKLNTIAIDGPVASGKTVVGTLLARRLGWRFLDTGAMYRGVTWAALTKSVDLDDHDRLGELAYNTKIEVISGDEGDRLVLDGQDVTSNLRSSEVEESVSLVARIGMVREVLVEKQRDLAGQGKIVMVGRDIGTVVLPDAGLKIFLYASVEERAKRRYQELQTLGQEVSYGQVLDDLQRRDKIDTERSHSPLKAAEDAHVINTSDMDTLEVVDKILAVLKEETWSLRTR